MLCSLFCAASVQARIDFVTVTEMHDPEGSIFKKSESRLFYVDASGLVICRASGLNSAPEYRIVKYGPEHVKKMFLDKIGTRDMQKGSSFMSELNYTTGFHININFAQDAGLDDVVHLVLGDMKKLSFRGEKVRRDVLEFYEMVSAFDCEDGKRWEPEFIKVRMFVISKKSEKRELEEKDGKGNNRYIEWTDALPRIDSLSNTKYPYGDYIYLGDSVQLKQVYRDLALKEAIRLNGRFSRVLMQPIFPAELRRAQEECIKQRTKEHAQCKRILNPPNNMDTHP